MGCCKTPRKNSLQLADVSCVFVGGNLPFKDPKTAKTTKIFWFRFTTLPTHKRKCIILIYFTDKQFTPQQIFEKSWQYSKDVYVCFVDFEKRIWSGSSRNLWRKLREYDVYGRLVLAVKSLHSCPYVCDCIYCGSVTTLLLRKSARFHDEKTLDSRRRH